MRLIEVHDMQAWEAFQGAQPLTQFPQSWAWGEFRTTRGCLVRRYAVVDDTGVWLAALQLEHRAKWFGVIGYWFAPRGPLFATYLDAVLKRQVLFFVCEQLGQVSALRRRTLFWRLEPSVRLEESEGILPLAFYRTDALNPSSTLLIDLYRSEQELLGDMHEKTRYNIRLAERRGVTIRCEQGQDGLDAFLDLMDETARRDRFIQHPRSHLTQTYHALAQHGMARLRFAEQNGRLLAASMEIVYGTTVTYLYGASSSEQRQLMAPYLLHWEAIRAARAQGARYYDFWGVNPEFKSMFAYKPSWEGISRFKRGFGGMHIDFTGTWDMPFNRFVYRLTHLKHFFRT